MSVQLTEVTVPALSISVMTPDGYRSIGLWELHNGEYVLQSEVNVLGLKLPVELEDDEDCFLSSGPYSVCFSGQSAVVKYSD